MEVAPPDFFYPAAEVVASTVPGHIIDSVEVSAPAGTRAWTIVYGSIGLHGEPVAVSGIVLAPAEPVEGATHPIVAWAHGTTGIADECAPSRRGSAGVGLSEVVRLVGQGYVVTATDYEGLGTDGTHPYLVGISEGRSVLDSIRAVQYLPDAHAAPEAVVIGFSQGGHAALWAAELAPTYAPEVDLRGVIGASPPTDLAAFETWAFGAAAQGNLPAAAAPLLLFGVWSDVYGLPLDFLTDEGQQSALIGRESCFPGDVTSTPYLGDPAALPDWGTRLTENSLGGARSYVPMLVVSPASDDQVPYETQVSGVAAMCAIGDTVELRTVTGDHGVSIYMGPQWDDYRAWVADRLAGVAPISTC